MSQDKELEIQIQFLDEACEYLTTIESAVLGIANHDIDSQQINGALRAAHSIKGGAAMMGFQALSDFAHRLEDSFKVLKVQKDQVDLDTELERLLLKGMDCLHHLVQDYRQQHEIDPDWLNEEAIPVFDQLHERLGDPQAEDANSVLSPEDGQDILPLLFQTEVEGCLQRIEAIVGEQGPCLQEEIEILAQELEGLGEMLQLSAFSQLCRSVTYALTQHPEQVDTIAHSALDAWRRSQALVLTGHLDSLPTGLEGFESPIEVEASVSTAAVASSLPDEDVSLTDSLRSDLHEAETDWDETAASLADVDVTTFGLRETADEDVQVSEITATAEAVDDSLGDRPSVPISESGLEIDDEKDEIVATSEADTLDAEFMASSSSPQWPSSPPQSSASLQNPASARGSSANSNTARWAADVRSPDEAAPADNTVRVPVKQLDQLNDLFGELTIERNRLDIEVRRLRSLLHRLGDRVQSLDQASIAIRKTYDRVTLNTGSELQPLLPPARNGDGGASLITPAPLDESDGSTTHLSAFDSLEMDQYGNLHLVFQDIMETIVQIQEVTSDLDLGLEDTEQTTRDLSKTSKQLRNNLTQLRMRPLSDITDRFPRALRELSLKHNKPVHLNLQGSHTLVDRNVLEALNDPMMHIIRNAFDHGIEAPEQRRLAGKPEEGHIQIQAQHQSNNTIITIRDDGHGIPIDKIRKRAQEMGLDEGLLAAASDNELLSLIFEPGFSTADQVTDLSGRGVGMDVVRNNLRQVRGDITVHTEAGIGTTFTITVPLVLSVSRVLIVESNRMLLAFSTDIVEEMILLTPDKIVRTAGSEAFDWEGMMVQLIRLSDWLSFNCPRPIEGLDENPTISEPSVLLLRQNNQLIGLQVDRCWGEQEVAMRQVAGGLPLPPGFGNCTILGDGSIVPLVNIADLLYWIASCEQAERGAIAPMEPSLPHIRSFVGSTTEDPSLSSDQKSTVLIVDDSVNVRRLLALTLEKAGYQVAQAKDGQDAVEKLSAGLGAEAVICDIEMPRLDGYGFLARIRSMPDFKQLPIAMLTSRSGDKHRKLAMNLGASAYFAKPYNEQMLLQTLNNMITLTPAS